MKENGIRLATDAQRMTSLEIARVTAKMHKDVMRAIRNMEPAWEKVNGRNFALVAYTDSKGEQRPCYYLSKTECLYIATKFNHFWLHFAVRPQMLPNRCKVTVIEKR